MLEDPTIIVENVYNIDKTRIMLSILGSIKVLVGKDNIRDYYSIRVKHTIVTIIEYISTNSRYLDPLVI